jgi:hypothetical protein
VKREVNRDAMRRKARSAEHSARLARAALSEAQSRPGPVGAGTFRRPPFPVMRAADLLSVQTERRRHPDRQVAQLRLAGRTEDREID